jgi:chemotaxis signal transduction protein
MLSTNVFPQRPSVTRHAAKQKLITFQIGSETYGLPIDRIKQILDEFNPHGVLDNGHGLVRYQNQTLTLLYPARLFPTSSSLQSCDYLMIAIAQGQTVGIPLPQLPRVMEVTELQFQPVPDLYRQVGISPAVKALIQLEQGSSLFVLDLEQLVLLQTQPMPANPTYQPMGDASSKLQVLDLPKPDVQQPVPEQSLRVEDFSKQDLLKQDLLGQDWEAIDFPNGDWLEQGEDLLVGEGSSLSENFLDQDLINQGEMLLAASSETWQMNASFEFPDFESSDFESSDFESSDFDLELSQQLGQEAEPSLSNSSSDLATDNLQEHDLQDQIFQVQNPVNHDQLGCGSQEGLSNGQDLRPLAPPAETELISRRIENPLENSELEIDELEINEFEFKFDGFELGEFEIEQFVLSDTDRASTFEHFEPNESVTSNPSEWLTPAEVSDVPEELGSQNINLPDVDLLDPDLIEQGEMLLTACADIWDMDESLNF